MIKGKGLIQSPYFPPWLLFLLYSSMYTHYTFDPLPSMQLIAGCKKKGQWKPDVEYNGGFPLGYYYYNSTYFHDCTLGSAWH